MENQDYIAKILKENVNLKIKNSVLLAKQSVYDILFDYMKMTNLYFHSFIMFFSSLQQSSPLPTSIVALSTKMFIFPDQILKIHEDFINEMERADFKPQFAFTQLHKDLNNILEYDKKDLRKTINLTFENVSDFDKNNKMFEQFMNLNIDTKTRIKKDLQIKNNIDLEPFIYNLKKIDTLWNLIGILFGKTPFLVNEYKSSLKDFNESFSLDKFVKFFSNLFEKEFNCIVNNRHKFYVDQSVRPILVIQEVSAPKLPVNLVTEINVSAQNYIYSNNQINFVDKHLIIQWYMFLEKVFKENSTKTANFFENSKKDLIKFKDPHLVNVVLQNLHCNKIELVRNSFLSVYKENHLLKQLLKFISVSSIYQSEYNKQDFNTPTAYLLREFKKYYDYENIKNLVN